LSTYAYSLIGDLPVGEVDRALVVKVLEPIWNTMPETAGRVRGRIEAVLDWAEAREYRTGANPARWKGSLEKLFPSLGKIQKVKHHPALPYAELPAFMARLDAEEGLGAMAMRFVVLTAVRTGEAIGASWPEFDLEKAVWTVPAERTKMGRVHRVPLSKAAVALLRTRHKATGGKGYIFPGMNPKKPLSNMAMLVTLRRMDREDLTVHGFRSTFRDWSEEMTNFPGSVAEAALGHIVGDKVEAAYRRGDLFDKRRLLMSAWGEFCTTLPTEGANVIPINERAVHA
jgi:integrase